MAAEFQVDPQAANLLDLAEYRTTAFKQARAEAELESDIAARAAEGEVDLTTLSIDEDAASRACDEQWADFVTATHELAQLPETEFSIGASLPGLPSISLRRRGRERPAPTSTSSPAIKSAPQRRGDAVVAKRDLAKTRFESSLRDAIARLLRTALEEKIDADYSTKLNVGPEEAPGLAELSGDELNAVETESVERLTQLLKRMPGGSIGLSGQRGSGKSTLIRKVCDGTNHKRDRPAVPCIVSAPTRYDGREFVLHLMGALCERIIGGPKARTQRKRLRAEAAAGPVGGSLLAFVAWLLSAIPVAGLLLVVAGASGLDLEPAAIAAGVCVSLAVPLLPLCFYYLPYPLRIFGGSRVFDLFPFRRRTEPRVVVATLLLAATALGLYAGFGVSLDPLIGWGIAAIAAAVIVRMILPALKRVEIYDDPTFSASLPGIPERLIRRAEDSLDTIEYQQTVTTGWSGAVKSQVGLEAGITASRARAEVPLTFPEVVALLRNFILDAATDTDVFIGIDELDKMQPSDADQFLNDIKAVFGITNCFFLVSVSEEAMSGFERRGARLRDVFDSSFDEIFQVTPMTLDESRLLLTERVSGVPVPYHALCHVMSGGLPRDTIRVARAMISLRPAGGPAELPDVAAGLIGLELKARSRAVEVIARELAVEPETSAFLVWAERLRAIPATANRLVGECRRHDFMAGPMQMPADQREPDPDRQARVTLQALSVELIGFFYFAATVLGLFDASLDAPKVKTIRKDASGGSLEDLAAARRLLAVNPRVGWARVDAFRKRRAMKCATFPLELDKDLAQPSNGDQPAEAAAEPTPA
jgi:hypothetical protein